MQNSSEAAAEPAATPCFDIDVPGSEYAAALCELHLHDPNAAVALNQVLALNLVGPLNHEQLHRAFDQVVSRHETLRATFDPQARQWTVKLNASRNIKTHIAGESAQARNECELALHETLTRFVNTPIEIDSGPLFESALFSPSDSEHVLILRCHEIVANLDGLALIATDLAQAYLSAATEPTRTPDNPVQASQLDFAGKNTRQTLGWWLAQPGNGLHSTQLSDRAADTLVSERCDLEVNARCRQQLLGLAQQLECDLGTVLFSGLATLAGRLTASTDVCIHCEQTTQPCLSGAQLPPMAVAVPVDLNISVSDAIRHCSVRLNDARQHQVHNVQELAAQADRLAVTSLTRNDSDASPGPGTTPGLAANILFSCLENLTPGNLDFGGPELQCVPLVPAMGFSRHPFHLRVIDNGESLTLQCQFNPQVFDSKTISVWLGAYRATLNGIAAEPLLPVGVVDIVDPKHAEMIAGFSTRTNANGDTGEFESGLINPNASPDKPALQHAGRVITYSELRILSSQVGACLRDLAIPSGEAVALMLSNDLHRQVVRTACLAQRVPFVDLPTDLPPQAQTAIATACSANVLVSTSSQPRLPEWAKGQTFLLDSQHEKIAQQAPESVELALPRPDAIAQYDVVRIEDASHASVPVPWQSISDALTAGSVALGVTERDRVVCINETGNGASMTVASIAIHTGACALLPTQEVLADGHLLLNWMNEQQATVMCAPASVWDMLLRAGWPTISCRPVINGKRISESLVTRLLARALTVYRITGCAETGHVAIATQISDAMNWNRLGQPQPGAVIRVMDTRGQPCPLGAPGEIMLGGRSLSDGYVDAILKKTERFLPDMFGDTPGRYLFRSGMTGYWRADGNLYQSAG